MLNKFFILIVFLSAGCTHSVHLVHVGDFNPYQPISSGKKIEATAEQFVILGFIQQTDYINQAREELMKKCPNGDIQGPVTRLSTSHGFFSWTNRVLIQALCVKLSPVGRNS